MKLEQPFRAATIGDCYKIAELFSIASDGVANYIWSTMTNDYPGLSLIDIGAKRYANEENIFGYKNCIMAEQDKQVIGMMLTFPTESSDEMVENSTNPSLEQEMISELDVLAPYSLEAPGTWYICALAVFPDYRNQGVGTQFLSIARQQAKEKGYRELSLLCFEQNTGALRLYQRNGFKEIARTAVVPHELIHYTGDILLMTAPV